jgi:hypothetical protein
VSRGVRHQKTSQDETNRVGLPLSKDNSRTTESGLRTSEPLVRAAARCLRLRPSPDSLSCAKLIVKGCSSIRARWTDG